MTKFRGEFQPLPIDQGPLWEISDAAAALRNTLGQLAERADWEAERVHADAEPANTVLLALAAESVERFEVLVKALEPVTVWPVPGGDS